MKQEFDKDGYHRLVDEETGETTVWASYRGWTHLNGYVGVTTYWLTGRDEKTLLTPEEFIALGRGKDF